jgi:glucose-6-phosphate isomerase
MLYSHDVSACLAGGGLTQAQLDARLKKAETALQSLRSDHDTGRLPLLKLPAERADLADALPIAEAFGKGATDIFIYGMGGSGLGGQVLAQLLGYGTPVFEWPKAGPRLHFFDNLDGQSLDAALARVDLKTTRFLVISKSGGTPETASQALASLDALEKAGCGKDAKHHFLFITEPKTSPMRRLAERLGAPTIAHPPAVGGRYSVLTVVGLVPARLAGLEVERFRAGAATVMEPLLKSVAAKDFAPAIGAALAVGLAEEKGMVVSVMMPYLDRLERFAMWYRQLWAESLGKKGKGTTPVRALGPVDQHSQVQLYLDGPKDKLFTFVFGPTQGTGGKITRALTNGDPELAYLEDRTVGDLAEAEGKATATALAQSGRPVRVIRLPKLNEESLGALLMHFMLETIIAGALMDVDPFDQPAVEQGKILTRQYLKDMGAGGRQGQAQ